MLHVSNARRSLSRSLTLLALSSPLLALSVAFAVLSQEEVEALKRKTLELERERASYQEKERAIERERVSHQIVSLPPSAFRPLTPRVFSLSFSLSLSLSLTSCYSLLVVFAYCLECTRVLYRD